MVNSSGPGVRGCCAMPHGAVTIIPVVLSFVTFGLSATAPLLCSFVNVEARGYDSQTSYLIVEEEIGLSRYCRHHYTRRYVDDAPQGHHDIPSFDPTIWRTANAFAFIAIILGSTGMVFTWCLTCIAYHSGVIIALIVEFVLAAVCQGLSLIVLASDMCNDTCDLPPLDGSTYYCYAGCEIGAGAGCAIGATIMYLLTAVSFAFLPGSASEKMRTNDTRPLLKEEEGETHRALRTAPNETA